MEDNNSLADQVEAAFAEEYSKLPLDYEPFGVKIVFATKEDVSNVAAVLVPCVFSSMEAALCYCDMLLSSPLSEVIIARWLNMGAIVLPASTTDVYVWRLVTAGVVRFSVGEILSDPTG